MPDIRPTVGSAALVLNATYEPLCVVSVRRAAILVLSAKAVCVADGDGILHSARDALPVPSVVRLTRYVRVPYRTHVGLSRRAIFARDGGRCAYCRGPAETIDHVHAAQPGRPARLGERGRRLRPVQPHQGRQDPGRARLAAARAAGRAEGHGLAGARPPYARPALGGLARPAEPSGRCCPRPAQARSASRSTRRGEDHDVVGVARSRRRPTGRRR